MAVSSPPTPAKSTPAIPLREQGFDADRDQDDAADDRGLVPQLHAEMAPDDQRDDAAQCGGQADQGGRRCDVERKRCETDTHGERIDARGNSLEEQDGNREFRLLIEDFFRLFMECIPEHLAADEPKDNERDDARIGFDEGPHQRTSIESDHGHEPLKDTEEDGHQETVGFIGSAIDEGVGHRYRKSVHGKGKSQNEKFDRAHGLVLPQFSMHDLFMTAQINRLSESIDFGCHMYRFIDIIYE